MIPKRTKRYLLGRELRFAVFFAVIGASLSGCGGASGGGGGVPRLGNGARTSTCLSTAAAKVISENPRIESPAIAFTASLAALGTNVTLSGLSGACQLTNTHLSVTSDDEFPTTIASQLIGFTAYNPTDARFQQLNTYYYATLARDMVLTAGGDLSLLSALKLDAHCVSAGGYSSANNAFYLPSANEVCFGYFVTGGKKLYASDDADVIIHEFGHAINHKIASTSIMNSSFESGSVDEGTADYWALTVNNNATLSEWFLGAMDSADPAATPDYQRVATDNHTYPDAMLGEIHADSRVWSQVLWTLRGALGSTKTNQLAVRAVDLMPATTRYRDAVAAVDSAATLMNLAGLLTAGDLVTISNALTAKGLLRADSAAGVALSTDPAHSAQYIVDGHSQSFMVGGNCNGVLDIGETAMVMFNLQTLVGNPTLGMGVGTLAAAGGSVGSATVVAAGSVAQYMRLDGNGEDFVDVLSTSGVYRDDATIAASFLIRGDTAGLVNMTLTFTPMNGVAVAIPVSFTVGSTAVQATACAGGLAAERARWPIP